MHMFRSSPARIVSRYHLRAIVRCAAVTVRLLPLLELRYLAPRLTVRASPLDIPLSLVLWPSRLAFCCYFGHRGNVGTLYHHCQSNRSSGVRFDA